LIAVEVVIVLIVLIYYGVAVLV